MSIRLARNVDFSASRRMIMPVDGVLLWSYFGNNLEDTRRNYADVEVPLAVVGSPSIGPNYADFIGLQNYLQSSISLTPDFTFVAVAQPLVIPPSGSNAPHLVSALTATSGAYRGSSLSLDSGVELNYIRAATSGTIGGNPNSRRFTVNQVPDWGAPRCYAATLKEGEFLRSRDLTSGTVSEATDSRTEIAEATINLRIGSSGSGTAAYGLVRMYSAVVLDHEASADELALVYSQLRRYHAVDDLAI